MGLLFYSKEPALQDAAQRYLQMARGKVWKMSNLKADSSEETLDKILLLYPTCDHGNTVEDIGEKCALLSRRSLFLSGISAAAYNDGEFLFRRSPEELAGYLVADNEHTLANVYPLMAHVISSAFASEDLSIDDADEMTDDNQWMAAFNDDISDHGYVKRPEFRDCVRHETSTTFLAEDNKERELSEKVWAAIREYDNAALDREVKLLLEYLK